MYLTWPDNISLAANLVTIAGVPLLYLAIRNLYREYRQQHAVRGITEGRLEFIDSQRNTVVALSPIERIEFLPRAGDFVSLPKVNGVNGESGTYKVEKVTFILAESPVEEQDCTLLKISANVRK